MFYLNQKYLMDENDIVIEPIKKNANKPYNPNNTINPFKIEKETINKMMEMYRFVPNLSYA